MFEYLGVRNNDSNATQCSIILDSAISSHLSIGKLMTYDLGGNASTSDVGDSISQICESL